MSRGEEDGAATAFLEEVGKTLTERAGSYPPYSIEASKVAQVWNALHPGAGLGVEDVALFMMIVKLVRLSAGNSPDSLTDLVGYAARLRGMECKAS